jgi:hypothetical protein
MMPCPPCHHNTTGNNGDVRHQSRSAGHRGGGTRGSTVRLGIHLRRQARRRSGASCPRVASPPGACGARAGAGPARHPLPGCAKRRPPALRPRCVRRGGLFGHHPPPTFLG